MKGESLIYPMKHNNKAARLSKAGKKRRKTLKGFFFKKKIHRDKCQYAQALVQPRAGKEQKGLKMLPNDKVYGESNRRMTSSNAQLR